MGTIISYINAAPGLLRRRSITPKLGVLLRLYPTRERRVCAVSHPNDFVDQSTNERHERHIQDEERSLLYE